ncbi:DUF423 domain-containing protein [Paenibacillus sp.]|uniref:DUF423 domain-containing protein n=1 Tax=Paenibacillus sp. TaxID=58172 RepID=UPI002D47EA12|nr:DUF423 domain-containing protein [Paenibacillus sp.]HZG58482.1 DUF423 domain-containing protein [Paenibacillus sp.]
MSYRAWVAAGAVSAFLSVAVGAFGAHGLQLEAPYADTYDTAVQYHMLHAIGMLAVGLAGASLERPSLLKWAGWAFAAGTLLFSGSLYLYSVTELSWLGAITPLGGLAFLAGWASFAAAARSAPKRR